MIQFEKKKEVFNLWFFNRLTKRGIARRLHISRGSVNTIIKEFQDTIAHLNLTTTSELMKHKNEIVLKSTIERKRSPRKLDGYTLNFIKAMVMDNEKAIALGLEHASTTKELYKLFLEQKKVKPELKTDFTIDTFYKYVRKIKRDIC